MLPATGCGASLASPPDMDSFAPFADWLGRTEERRDTITATPSAALAATLDRRRSPTRARHAAAAALALALLPAAAPAMRDRRRRPPEARRLPAAGAAAAPHVGRQPARFARPAAHRRRGRPGPRASPRRRSSRRLGPAGVRDRRARDRRRRRHRDQRRARHRLPRLARRRRAARAAAGRADRRVLRAPSPPTRCCCSAIRR